MTTFAVLATGPSMSQSLADFVRDSGCRAVAVSNAYVLAPWADALVSNDQAWWKHNPDALKFAGRKFCGAFFKGTERLRPDRQFPGITDTNSGVQGMRVAAMLGATRILLLGFDMHGTHFFGLHKWPLTNADARKHAKHVGQFDGWRGCEVINCTPGSALKRFPFADIVEVLQQ